jgi:hypothetical protein
MNKRNPVEFEGLMEVIINNTAFWCVTPCNLVTDYTAFHNRRQYFLHKKFLEVVQTNIIDGFRIYVST